MNNDIQNANLELLIGLRQHLDHAAKLRTLLDRLLSLAERRPRARRATVARERRERQHASDAACGEVRHGR